MGYYVMAIDLELDDAAVLSTHPSREFGDQGYRFKEGVSLRGWLPEHVPYAMSPRYPEARALCPFQVNTLELIIPSGECRRVMEEGGKAGNIEFLPITIINHRGKVASEDYCIANLLGSVDCMDREESVYRNSSLDPSVLSTCTKLVLREERIPEDVELFRLSNGLTTYIAGPSLKERLEARGLTKGVRFIPVEEYDSDLV